MQKKNNLTHKQLKALDVAGYQFMRFTIDGRLTGAKDEKQEGEWPEIEIPEPDDGSFVTFYTHQIFDVRTPLGA